MQDCSTLNHNPPPVEEDYCATVQMSSEPGSIYRGCLSLLRPEWRPPSPPVGGSVCIDVDTDDSPPQKVFNEYFFTLFNDILILRLPSACVVGRVATSLRLTTPQCNHLQNQHQSRRPNLHLNQRLPSTVTTVSRATI